QGGTNVNIASFKKLKDEIAAKKAEIAGSTESFLQMGGTFGKVAKAIEGGGEGLAGGAKGAADAMRALGGSIRLVDGPAGGFLKKAGMMVKSLGKAGVAGLALLAVVALVVL